MWWLHKQKGIEWSGKRKRLLVFWTGHGFSIHSWIWMKGEQERLDERRGFFFLFERAFYKHDHDSTYLQICWPLMCEHVLQFKPPKPQGQVPPGFTSLPPLYLPPPIHPMLLCTCLNHTHSHGLELTATVSRPPQTFFSEPFLLPTEAAFIWRMERQGGLCVATCCMCACFTYVSRMWYVYMEETKEQVLGSYWRVGVCG